MAYDNNDSSPRQMYQGDWKCSNCGASITELPFQPDPSRTGELLCKDCHRQKRSSFSGSRGGFRGGDRGDRGGSFQRQMYQGNWKCSNCGASITELPFQPDPSREGQLLCRDCHRQRRSY